MKIHETTNDEGGLSPVSLGFVAGALHITADRGSFPLPAGGLAAVMRRFGGPLDPGERITRVASLSLGEAEELHHVRHLSGYDVIARDYLVYERGRDEPLCALSVTIAGALLHLALVASGTR